MKSYLERPFGITILALFVLCLTAWNGLHLGVAISFWNTLRQYNAQPEPLYIAVTGGFWLLAGIPLFWGLWRGYSWARNVTLITAAIYMSWYWFDRLAIQPIPHSNWPFVLSVNILILVFTAIVLFNPQSTFFFKQRETHDRKS
jgi:hypothetical protein